MWKCYHAQQWECVHKVIQDVIVKATLWGKEEKRKRDSRSLQLGKSSLSSEESTEANEQGKLPEAAEMAREMDCTALLVHKWAQVCFNKAIASAH